MWRTILVYSLVVISLEYVRCKSTLKFVFVTTRGGDHEICTYIGGPNFTNITVDEWNTRLTLEGKKTAFKLGRILSKKYKKRLGISSRKNKNFWSFAGNGIRHKEGALILGAGLQNNICRRDTVWTEGQLNKAIYPQIDYFYRFFKPTECPAFFVELATKLKDKLAKLSKTYAKSIQTLEKKYPEVNTSIPFQIWISYETMERWKDHGIDLPWYTPRIRNDLLSFSEKFLYYSLTYTNKLRRLSGGPILSSILNDMRHIIHGYPQPLSPGGYKTKMSIFTTSQTVVGAQIAAFAPKGTKIGRHTISSESFYPEIGSAHIIELHKVWKNKWAVKMIYKNGGKSYIMRLPGCDVMCPFRKFQKILSRFNLSEKQQQEECKIRTN